MSSNTSNGNSKPVTTPEQRDEYIRDSEARIIDLADEIKRGGQATLDEILKIKDLLQLASEGYWRWRLGNSTQLSEHRFPKHKWLGAVKHLEQMLSTQYGSKSFYTVCEVIGDFRHNISKNSFVAEVRYDSMLKDQLTDCISQLSTDVRRYEKDGNFTAAKKSQQKLNACRDFLHVMIEEREKIDSPRYI